MLYRRARIAFQTDGRTMSNAIVADRLLADEATNNVKHAQLRMNCSKLNAHPFMLHASDTTQCSCGFQVEDTKYILLHSPLYQVPQQWMMQTIVRLNIVFIAIDVLLYGNEQNRLVTNKGIFSANKMVAWFGWYIYILQVG